MPIRLVVKCIFNFFLLNIFGYIIIQVYIRTIFNYVQSWIFDQTIRKKNIFDDKLVYQGTYISDILKHPLVSYLSIIFTAMKKLISFLKTTLDIIKNTCPNFFDSYTEK